MQQPISEKNQPIWDKFQADRLKTIYAKQQEKGEQPNQKMAMLNMAQYHEVAICLDSLQKDWTKLTLEQVEKAKTLKPLKNNHINGLLIACYVNGWIPVNRDIAVNLIPVEYRQLVKMIL